MSIFGSSPTEKTHNSLCLLYSGAFSSSGKKNKKTNKKVHKRYNIRDRKSALGERPRQRTGSSYSGGVFAETSQMMRHYLL